MKKHTIVVALSCFLLIFAPGVVGAQNGQQDRTQDPTAHDADTYVAGEEGVQQRDASQDGTGSDSGQSFGQGLEGSSQSLSRVATRSNNPETGEQVRVMAEKHEQIQVKTQTSLNQMSKRSGLGKFLLGPDYKNAGEVKGVITQLNEDIDTLTGLGEDLTGEDATDIQGAIDELEAEVEVLENELSTQTSGFSLFGWLGKIVSGY